MRSSLKERLSLLPEIAYKHVFRASAGGEDAGSSYLDFSVLSVAVTTLGLILLVQLVRQRLDRNATGRPFFKTVLEGVYRELATLGMVEFVIFLLHKYYEDLNVAQELVFADVHFTLFFTALFNAFQSCILAFFISRNSHRLWVQTEYQDLHHYVEIREEYERLSKELQKFRDPIKESVQGSPFNPRKTDRSATSMRQSVTSQMWTTAESENVRGEFRHSMQSIKRILYFLLRSVRYPRLSRKHNDLLVQVRFHELKFHFIQANKLPITMHLSDYLKRCELRILQKLVHIRTLAWLLLTAGINLLYFLMGVVVYTTNGDLEAVGRSLTAIFFSGVIFSVLLSLIIWNKMTWIFHTIMHTKLITQSRPVEEHENDQPSDQPATNGAPEFDQQSLFWGSSPRFIIIMIQFMQFGFALALSILLVFWDDIHPQNDSPGIPGQFFLFAVVLCYVCFVAIISNVVPRFTLCSSIGQMVDRDQLHETLARHRLEEAQRERQQRLMEREFEETYRKEEEDYSMKFASFLAGHHSQQYQQQQDASASRVLMDPTLLHKLIQTSTKDLRNSLPEKEQDVMNEMDRSIQARRGRRKTLSDGVEAMREMIGLGSETSSSPVTTDSRKSRRHTRKKSLSASASIQMMRDVKSLTVPLKVETTNARLKTRDDLELSLADRAQRRASRKKTISASADIQMMRIGSHRDVLHSSSVSAPIQTKAFHEDGPADAKRVSFSLPSPSLVSPQEQLRKYLPECDQHPLMRIPESESDHMQSCDTDRTETPSPWVNDSRLSVQEVLAEHHSNTIIENFKTPTLGDEGATQADSDDEHSDVDDLPEIQESEKLRQMEPSPPKRTPVDVARAYFRGRQYILVSSVFGTMVCFFVVGMRLEAVLIETGVFYNYDNTWHFEAKVSFWLEFALLTCFSLGDFIILYLFRPARMFDNRDRRVFAAATIDLLICMICISCLVAAQVQRCCDDAENRFLGESTSEGYYGYQAIACCPAFGTRLYGGFGSVEMFTSLVGLRVMRFFAAKLCIQGLYRKCDLPESATTVADGDSPPVEYPFDPFYEVSTYGHSKATSGGLQDESGTIVELWKSALALHPDVVAKHGEFSSQLLQAMLGIPVIDDDLLTSADDVKEEDNREGVVDSNDLGFSLESPSRSWSRLGGGDMSRSRLGSDDMSRRRLGSGDMSTSRRRLGSEDTDLHHGFNHPSIVADMRYSGLSPAAQSVILAGKLGKSVRARNEFASSMTLGSLTEETPTSIDGARINELSPKRARLPDSHEEMPSPNHVAENQVDLGMQFEIITDDGDDESASQFFAANARLIRNMRRCDRKVIPMLDRWAVVDVVMTNFEIVYFDATQVDNLSGVTNPRAKRLEDIRQAIIATKGGKGLRLRDVAYGRKVVGNQVLNDIEEIHVDRTLPYTNRNDAIEPTGREPDADEFWKDKVLQNRVAGDSRPEDEKMPRHSRWVSIKEDKLKVKTKHDTTLYLRFYSDLENCEAHIERMMNEQESEGPLFKNNAFQWCQTIGRIVGASKLKQDLPHFGDDSCDELRDYLVVVDPNKEQGAIPAVDRFKKMVALHRRQRSDVTSSLVGARDLPSHSRHRSEIPSLRLEEIDAAPASTPVLPLPRPKPVRRATSLVESLKGSAAAIPSLVAKPAMKLHVRRSSSVGETVSGIPDLTLPSQDIQMAGLAVEDAPDSSFTNGGNTLA